MFTGLVQEMGTIHSIASSPEGVRLSVGCTFFDTLVLGESVSVSGVCLTVSSVESGFFVADVIPATLEVTNFAHLQVGGLVNLERALCVGDRLGGHFVQGHVDGVGRVVAVSTGDSGCRLVVQSPAPLRRFIALKGSITLDGVSLTVSSVFDDGFEVSLVPHTLVSTTLGSLTEGALLNLEVDLLARYIDQLNL